MGRVEQDLARGDQIPGITRGAPSEALLRAQAKESRAQLEAQREAARRPAEEVALVESSLERGLLEIDMIHSISGEELEKELAKVVPKWNNLTQEQRVDYVLRNPSVLTSVKAQVEANVRAKLAAQNIHMTDSQWADVATMASARIDSIGGKLANIPADLANLNVTSTIGSTAVGAGLLWWGFNAGKDTSGFGKGMIMAGALTGFALQSPNATKALHETVGVAGRGIGSVLGFNAATAIGLVKGIDYGFQGNTEALSNLFSEYINLMPKFMAYPFDPEAFQKLNPEMRNMANQTMELLKQESRYAPAAIRPIIDYLFAIRAGQNAPAPTQDQVNAAAEFMAQTENLVDPQESFAIMVKRFRGGTLSTEEKQKYLIGMYVSMIRKSSNLELAPDSQKQVMPNLANQLELAKQKIKSGQLNSIEDLNQAFHPQDISQAQLVDVKNDPRFAKLNQRLGGQLRGEFSYNDVFEVIGDLGFSGSIVAVWAFMSMLDLEFNMVKGALFPNRDKTETTPGDMMKNRDDENLKTLFSGKKPYRDIDSAIKKDAESTYDELVKYGVIMPNEALKAAIIGAGISIQGNDNFRAFANDVTNQKSRLTLRNSFLQGLRASGIDSNIINNVDSFHKIFYEFRKLREFASKVGNKGKIKINLDGKSYNFERTGSFFDRIQRIIGAGATYPYRKITSELSRGLTIRNATEDTPGGESTTLKIRFRDDRFEFDVGNTGNFRVLPADRFSVTT